MGDKVVAVVPAAGKGSRMGGPVAKQYLALAGMPILVRTLAILEAVGEVEAVILVVSPGREEEILREITRPYGLAKVVRVVPGGAERQDSVAAGLLAARESGASLVAVHDAVRPLCPPELFSRVIAAARRFGAALAAVPVVDTVKLAPPEGPPRVEATLDRSRLWQAQTPQAFRLELLLEALEAARREGLSFTDEAGLLEMAGVQPRLVMGHRLNVKITTPEDLVMAEALIGRPFLPRVGQGYDVHRLVPDRKLVLCGVEVPHETGLLGHSDADVALHALMDALLAGAGLGDIGGLFPDSDPAYEGASSLALLARVTERLAGEGWRPVQASVTIVAQRPRLAPHIPAMREKLCRALGLEAGEVNVAATTTEGLGFAGREEGIAALATAVLGPL